MTDDGGVAGAVRLVQFDDALEVHFLLVGIPALAPLLAELLVVVVPSFESVPVKFVQLGVGLLIDIDDEVHHSSKNLLIHNGISGSFADVFLWNLGAGGPWHVLWGLLVGCLASNLLSQEVDGSA